MGLSGGMAEAENRPHGIKPSPLKKGEPKSMSKRKVKEARFRVCCLNPLLGWAVLSPDENNPLFRLAKLSAEGHRNFMKWALTTWRAGNPTYSNILKLADEVDRI